MPKSDSIRRAVVFDLDGTLLDTLADIGNAANAVLAQLGFAAHALDEYRQFVGEGVAMLFQRALAAEQPAPEIISRCASAFQVAYNRNWNQHTRPYPGIPELLDALAARGVKMAVLSNKPHEFTRRCVDHYFPATRFAAVLGQREGVPRKPDPAGALEIAQQLCIPADEFLYLGDSAIDMRTAQSAGMQPIGAAWGFRSLEELRSGGTTAVIAQPIELLPFLDGLGTAADN